SHSDDSEKKEMMHNVTQIITAESLVESMGLSGQANIWFMVDENNQIHVERVETADFLSEYHIRQSLEGAMLKVKESFIGKTFAIVIDFVQSK
ncbi:MAG: hypothetical protein ACK4IY_10455, partial [Chitinophagales bacterium]